ncbi:MAG: carboxypeptidase-like regulatory domain-containing protein [Flavobacteriaceae bacterium]|nr:carboxypeptidase-like regulatory domain-containing protein [Flavobacteriaceae bacterium]
MSFSQSPSQTWLHGKVLYLNNNVIAANVINNSTQQATITNENGEFSIKVALGDQLIFSSLQYQIKAVQIDEEILKKNRLVVEVNEKVTELSEVVVGPENTEKFLALKEEEFKSYDYLNDKSTRVQNTIMQKDQLTKGINFVNIFKAISKSLSNKSTETANNSKFKPSDLIRQLYEDSFFVESLGIPQNEIGSFLLLCDDELPSQSLLKKNQEFQLIDFLVKQSQRYKLK